MHEPSYANDAGPQVIISNQRCGLAPATGSATSIQVARGAGSSLVNPPASPRRTSPSPARGSLFSRLTSLVSSAASDRLRVTLRHELADDPAVVRRDRLRLFLIAAFLDDEKPASRHVPRPEGFGGASPRLRADLQPVEDLSQVLIIDLAARLGRTPGSVAMKLNNLASLDPALQLRGIRSLPGASALDRTLWDEFHENPAELVPLSQERFDALFVESETETTEVIPGTGIRRINRPPTGETEITRPTKQRRGQDYFREIVLNNYGNRCGLTGLPIRELLIASHILPWNSHEAERLDVRNGICLNRLHDAAFDQGLISFDGDLRLLLSSRLKTCLPHESVQSSFEAYQGKPLDLPDDALPPDREFLTRHRLRFGIC